MAKIETVIKGDIIVERSNGKNRMIPVRKVEHNVCSKRSVHINDNACYDWGTDIRLAEAEGTLGDLEAEVAGLGDLETDEPESVLESFTDRELEAFASGIVKGLFGVQV